LTGTDSELWRTGGTAESEKLEGWCSPANTFRVWRGMF